jgi:uncharacterized protein YprB with RNaseH-like and TPR domain
MARAPVTRMTKKEVDWLGTHRCRHHHTYLEHYSCFIDENPLDQRLGFLDIETHNLVANYGFMICFCIKDSNSDTILEDIITKKELQSSELDKRVVKRCIEEMKKFDKVITYYGTRFDIPFIRTRAHWHGLDFPEYGELMHFDVYYTVRNKVRLSSNRLGVACEALLGSTNKTRLDPVHVQGAMQGRTEALEYYLDHCRGDVIDLQRLYEKVIVYKKTSNTST